MVDLDAVRARDPAVARVLAAGDELEAQVAVEELAQRQSGKPVQTHRIATYLRAKSSISGAFRPLGTITTGQAAVRIRRPETSPSSTAGAGP